MSGHTCGRPLSGADAILFGSVSGRRTGRSLESRRFRSPPESGTSWSTTAETRFTSPAATCSSSVSGTAARGDVRCRPSSKSPGSRKPFSRTSASINLAVRWWRSRARGSLAYIATGNSTKRLVWVSRAGHRAAHHRRQPAVSEPPLVSRREPDRGRGRRRRPVDSGPGALDLHAPHLGSDHRQHIRAPGRRMAAASPIAR